MLTWLEQTPVAQWVATSAWGYPMTLASHGVGMAIVVGVILMISLRVLGVFKSIPLASMSGLMPYLWAGFLLNLVSGLLLFAADAERFFFGWTFQVKMLFIVVGLVVVVVLDATAVRPAAQRGGDAALPGFAKPLAVVSILIWWLAVVLSGRLIAYLI